jgi:predicted GNAT family acetyltransferase
MAWHRDSFTFNILQKEKVKFHDFILKGENVVPNSQVYPSCSYYRLQAIKNYEFWVASNGVCSCNNKIWQKVLEKHDGRQADRQTYTIIPVCVHFMHITQRTHNNTLLQETPSSYASSWILTPKPPLDCIQASSILFVSPRPISLKINFNSILLSISRCID